MERVEWLLVLALLREVHQGVNTFASVLAQKPMGSHDDHYEAIGRTNKETEMLRKGSKRSTLDSPGSQLAT